MTLRAPELGHCPKRRPCCPSSAGNSGQSYKRLPGSNRQICALLDPNPPRFNRAGPIRGRRQREGHHEERGCPPHDEQHEPEQGHPPRDGPVSFGQLAPAAPAPSDIRQPRSRPRRGPACRSATLPATAANSASPATGIRSGCRCAIAWNLSAGPIALSACRPGSPESRSARRAKASELSRIPHSRRRATPIGNGADIPGPCRLMKRRWSAPTDAGTMTGARPAGAPPRAR